jgi:chromosome partitioning protein
MKTLVFANQKGGVGKSALATQFAHYLHRQGKRVLVIDFDHQQNTSRPLKSHADVSAAAITASTVFEAGGPHVLPTSDFVLIAGDDRLSAIERQADQHNIFVNRFNTALNNWDRFDFCLIDTNPNPDIRYAAALVCSDYVLAPIQLNQEAIVGISALLGHPRYGIHRIAATLNPRLRLLGILPNLVEHTPFQKENLKALVGKFGNRLLSRQTDARMSFGYIHKRTAIAEAQAAGAFVADMDKTSARDTWRELQPVFDMVLAAMDVVPATEVPA